MTTKTATTEQVLKTVLQETLKNSTKEVKNQITDIARMNNSAYPYIVEQIRKGSNIHWTISEIQNMMKTMVVYSPKDKEDRNPAFEMRVLASAEQIVLKMERVNPYAFGEYDAKGVWKDFSPDAKDENFSNPLKLKSYNVKFNDTENGFDFDEKGNLEIANKFILPVIENVIKVNDNTKKTEYFANQTDTKQAVSKAIAQGFFKRAYPQAKKSRATKPLTENEHIQNADKLTKYVQDINVVYAEYVKSGGKSGNAERLLEKDAKILMTLKDEINTMLTTRGNAEDLAYEIEQGQRKAG